VKRLIILIWLLGLVLPLHAEQKLLMVRVDMKAPRTMDVLKETLREYGYEVAHVQRCDGGMSEFHYKTDYYRVVFFGKINEVRGILASYPEMSPYLPLKIAVIAEKDQTVLAALDPRALTPLFAHSPELGVQFARWHNDIDAILKEMRDYGEHQKAQPQGESSPPACAPAPSTR
jgi:uncharacterized protein (DUF302 family)